MKSNVLITALAVSLSSGAAFAADLPSKKGPVAAPAVVSPWDFDIGAGVTSDYIFRGISQSAHNPSVAAHGELRYNFNDTWQGYVGLSGESIKLSYNFSSPSMELDTYGGLRGTFGKFTTDTGIWGYLYPGLNTNPDLPTQISWFELYEKLGYNITDSFNVGLNFYYTPSYINTKANGEYLSLTAKYTVTDAFSVSGELGEQFLGRPDATHDWAFVSGNSLDRGKYPNYTTWNVGGTYTYKFVSLDLRYYGTNLSSTKAYNVTGIDRRVVGNAPFTSNLARAAFVATLSFDLTSKDLK
jgi:uncharacterized protein (TIGR02001 family)